MAKKLVISDNTKFLLWLFTERAYKRYTIAESEKAVSFYFPEIAVSDFLFKGVLETESEYGTPVIWSFWPTITYAKKFWNTLQNEEKLRNNFDALVIRMSHYIIAQTDLNIHIWDISDVMKTLTENKIFSDDMVKKYIPIMIKIVNTYNDALAGKDIDKLVQVDMSEEFYMPMNQLIQKRYNVRYEVYLMLLECRKKEYDGHENREKVRQLFCEIEADNRKLLTSNDYHPDIDALDLYNLKRLLADRHGNMFRLIWRQAELILCMKRFTDVVWSRRAGKTTAWFYLGARQLYLPLNIITYVVPTLSRHARAPYRKYKQWLKYDFEIKDSKNNRQIFNTRNEAELQFYSTERGDGIRSDESNLLIFDEVAYIALEDYQSAYPIVMTVDGFIYSVSTFHRKTPQNRWYYKVIEGEIDKYNPLGDRYTKRVTLDINPFISNENKDRIRRDFKDDPRAFAIEYMCDAQTSKIFHLDNFWKIDYEPMDIIFANLWKTQVAANYMTDYENFVLAYDPWKSDQPWVVVVWFHKKDKVRRIILADYISKLWYLEQTQVYDAMVTYFTIDKVKPTVLLELNNTWEVITEILQKEYMIAHKRIRTAAINKDKYEDWVYTMDRGRAVSSMQLAMIHSIQALSFLTKLRIEIEWYDPDEESKNVRGKSWEVKHHFDILSALRMITRYLKRVWLLTQREERSEGSIYESENYMIDRSWWYPVFHHKNNTNDTNRIEQFWY